MKTFSPKGTHTQQINPFVIILSRIQLMSWRKMRGKSSGGGERKKELTVDKRGEEHAEAAQSALLVRPHPHDSHAIIQHHIIGHSATKLGFEVFNGTAAIIHSHKILLAFIRVLHLVLHEAQVDLPTHSIFSVKVRYCGCCISQQIRA